MFPSQVGVHYVSPVTFLDISYDLEQECQIQPSNPIQEVVADVKFQSLWQMVGVILRQGLFQSPSYDSILASDPEYPDS